MQGDILFTRKQIQEKAK